MRGGVVALGLLLLAAVAAAPGAAAATPISATAETVAGARAAGLRVAVAVTDTTTGTTTVAGEAGALFPSESVVKVLIAARLIVDGQLTGAVGAAAASMISASDDEAANSLWGLVGGPEVVTWATERYGLTGLGEPSEWGWWGNTKVSAAGLAALYAALLDDPAVAPWLVGQLSAMTPVATDGTDQTFGFGAAVAAGTAAVKQGWGGDDDAESTANLLSTGYLADGRFAVALIVQDPGGGPQTALVPTIDAVAAAVTTDTTAALEAESASAGVAAACGGCADSAEVMAPADRDVTARRDNTREVGEAASAWWPASVTVLGLAAFLGATTAGVSVWQRRRATAPPS